MGEMEKKRSHILLLPFMAQGHLKPFLELAHHIKRRSSGLTITLLSTPLNVRYLRNMSAESDCAATAASSTVIRLVELPFRCSDHGLPDQAENAHVLSLTEVIKLFHASSTLEAPVREFVAGEIVGKEGCPPLCIISDVFLGWAIDVARSFGSLSFVFTTGGAYGSTAYISIWRDLPHQHCTDEQEFCLPGFPETHRFNRSQLHRFLRAANGTDDWSKFFQPQIRMSMESSGWLCNTIEEVEPLGMSILRDYVKSPVWAIGSAIPISMSPATARSTKDPSPKEGIIGWLDLQPEDSVLYISFGSQNTITSLQMMELAASLDESGRRFLWVIRPPFGFDINGEFRSEWLPDGFEERVIRSQNRGLLVHKWAPQTDILSHKSTGAFLSHCGWNSVMESLIRGVPMIGWPLAAEQAYNSKMLEEETGVALELTRGLEGKLTKERVKEVIDIVMDRQGKGGEMKKKATEMSEKIRLATTEDGGRKGSSLMAMDDFLQTVLKTAFDDACLLFR
ncbi:hypothetical protein V2J09_001680 [Rumex salicifolius]